MEDSVKYKEESVKYKEDLVKHNQLDQISWKYHWAQLYISSLRDM